MKRAFIMVLDSFGIGATEDAERFGDVGADTLGHIAEACAKGEADNGRKGPLNLPNLTRLGLAKAHEGSTGFIPAGMDGNAEVLMFNVHSEFKYTDIPLKDIKFKKNLLVAGRCISATHEAQASFRVMPFCSALGQAAGAATALAVKSGKSLREIDLSALRAKLRNEGFVI